MSGAGKTQAVKVFEDLDYYILDNLPPALMPSALIECRRVMPLNFDKMH